MVENIDYGKIPGTGSKPTLLKAGAEKLAMMFQFDVEFETQKNFHNDGHLTVESKCILFHAPSGTRLGSANAVCSTRESKYAYRKAQRICPVCNKPAIIKGKVDYGGGWLCWKKRDGCGMQFNDDEPAIVDQQEGEIPNDRVADQFNTCIRMSEKRALIAAVRIVTGCSSIFDEEMPDMNERTGAEPPKQVYPTDDPPKAKSKHPGDDLPDWIDRQMITAWDNELVSCGTLAELKEVWAKIVKADPAVKGDPKKGVYQAYLKPIKDKQKAAIESMPPTPKEEPWS